MLVLRKDPLILKCLSRLFPARGLDDVPRYLLPLVGVVVKVAATLHIEEWNHRLERGIKLILRLAARGE